MINDLWAITTEHSPSVFLWGLLTSSNIYHAVFDSVSFRWESTRTNITSKDLAVKHLIINKRQTQQELISHT
jgi:hypothetical protein